MKLYKKFFFLLAVGDEEEEYRYILVYERVGDKEKKVAIRWQCYANVRVMVYGSIIAAIML